MKSSRFGTRFLASLVLCTSLGVAGMASAALQWCFELGDTGQQICIPTPAEEILVKLPPDPGPYVPVDISSFSQELTRILGSSQTKWVVTRGSGDRVVLMDLETQTAIEVEQSAQP